MPIRDKFTNTREEMKEVLIERDDEIDLSLTALLANEHVLFVGPPGTAKSYMLNGLFKWFEDDDEGTKFDILIGKYTTSEDLFGPISVMGLKNDQYRRITKGMFPNARFAFIDEIFKAQSGILNTLLRGLNERLFNYNGDGTYTKMPLELCVAASNEWPNDQEGGKELGALFDRFLFRKSVRPISTIAGRRKLLWGGDHELELTTKMSIPELRTARKEVRAMVFPQEVQQAFMQILEELGKEGIRPGDRRQYKAVRAVQAYSWLMGEGNEVEKDHLDVLSHVLWDDPTEQPEKCGKIVARIASPVRSAVLERLLQAQDVVEKCTPTDAVPKLKEIYAQVEALGEHPKKKNALRQLAGMIRETFHKVVGHNEEEFSLV